MRQIEHIVIAEQHRESITTPETELLETIADALAIVEKRLSAIERVSREDHMVEARSALERTGRQRE
jgi:hypothetical protein